MNINSYHKSAKFTVDKGISYKYNCCGCGACKNVCPKQCIELVPDKEGFLYPLVDEDICTDCGLCIESCQYIERKNHIKTANNPKVYAAKSINSKKLRKSSSGGVTQVFSEKIINENGVVFGAAYNAKMKVEHIEVDKLEDLVRVQSSKYVQSDIKNTYQKAKQFLIDGKEVLFTGTPCQIAGLYYFLGKDYKNLYTIDLICFGVPSPKVFGEYIKIEEQNNSCKVVDINFRDKTLGWNKPCTNVKFDNKNKNRNEVSSDNKYYRVFLSHIATRPSCHNCLYTKLNRYSDITVGDYWGIEKFDSSIDSNAGISKVLINTQKGLNLFNSIRTNIVFEEMPLITAIRPNLKKPPQENKNRNNFFRNLNKKGFTYCYKKYIKMNTAKKIKKKILNILHIIVYRK